jgi:16S rRNA processing protein RimM
MNKSNVYVAKLGKTVGLKGDIKLFIDSDFPEQFKQGACFNTNRNLRLKVVDVNHNKGSIRFENYEDIDLAKKLTNQQLFTSYEQTKMDCNLNDNEFFWFDLMDCNIEEDGKNLGSVVDIHRYPLNDYLEIKTSDDLLEEKLPKTFLLPHIFDQYILDVDIENKTIKTKDAYSILENS